MTDSTDTDSMIEFLAAEARPVRRLRPPMVRALACLAVSLALIASFALFHGLTHAHGFHGMWMRLATVHSAMQIIASLATGVTAVLAAFEVSIPGTPHRWTLLPLPAVILWFASVGYGCLTDWLQQGPEGLEIGPSFACFLTILGTSIPLGALLAVMLRHAAATTRPMETITLGALGLAALSATGLSFYHEFDATIMVLIWHGGSTLFVVFCARLAGARLLRRAANRAATRGI